MASISDGKCALEDEETLEELSHRVETVNQARGELKSIAEKHSDERQLCTAASQVATQLKEGDVVNLVVLVNGHGPNGPSLGSHCRNVSRQSKSPAVRVSDLLFH